MEILTEKIQLQKSEQELIEQVIEYYKIAVEDRKTKENFSHSQLLKFYKGQLRDDETTSLQNYILTIIDSGLSLLTRTPITIEFIPPIKELEKAKEYYLFDQLRLGEKIGRLLLYLKLFGTAFFYPHFIRKNGILQLKLDVLSEGVYIDPSAKRIEDAEFMFYATPVPLMKLRDWYRRGNLVAEEKITHEEAFRYEKGQINKSTYNSVKLPSAMVIFGFLRDKTVTTEKIYRFKFYCTKCRKFFYQENISIENLRCHLCGSLISIKYVLSSEVTDEREIPLYPRGRMVVIANTSDPVLLEDIPNPYYDFPFIHFINRDVTEFWGMGDVELLLSEQITLNKLTTETIKIFSKILKRPIISDDGAITSYEVREFGDIIQKMPGTQVEFMNAPTSLPFDTFRFMEMLRQIMDNKGGLYDRIGIKTATEAELLQQEEINRQTRLFTSIESKMKDVVLHIFHILTHYHTYQERIAWEEGRKEYVLFRGIDYKEKIFDVKVRFQTERLKSKIIRQHQAIQILNSLPILLPLLTPEEKQKLVRKIIEDLDLGL